jgi:hypothetical protein
MILIPQFRNSVETLGTLSIVHTDELGNLKDNRYYSNVVTVIGKKWLAARMKDTVASVHTIPAQMSHMAVGGNATVGAAITKITTDMSTLEALTVVGTAPTIGELNRQALTTAGGTFAAYGSTGVNNLIPTTSTITYAASFIAGQGTGAIIQAGIFNASSAGVMLCVTSFDVVNKQANDSIAITWTINIS